jgi:hypothetical protein
MHDFVLRTAKQTAVFRFGPDFTEGERRLCWTAKGIEKLIDLGLWQRELDARGNLKSKPIRVEAAMRLPIARPVSPSPAP